MDSIEAVTSVLVLVLGVVSLVAICIGVLSLFGAVRMSRCNRCGHLWLTSADEALLSCAYCRHEQLLHPITALHHAHPHNVAANLVSRHRHEAGASGRRRLR